MSQLADGQNNRGIARRLNISERTVRNHLSRISSSSACRIGFVRRW
ncbi:LuxR C-terminal-related transcriptional regulator [Micromonospora ureilytica]|nr:LuxR C-terminal-related transcriptional regulator [Micromonospora ureilytica]